MPTFPWFDVNHISIQLRDILIGSVSSRVNSIGGGGEWAIFHITIPVQLNFWINPEVVKAIEWVIIVTASYHMKTLETWPGGQGENWVMWHCSSGQSYNSPTHLKTLHTLTKCWLTSWNLKTYNIKILYLRKKNNFGEVRRLYLFSMQIHFLKQFSWIKHYNDFMKWRVVLRSHIFTGFGKQNKTLSFWIVEIDISVNWEFYLRHTHTHTTPSKQKTAWGYRW